MLIGTPRCDVLVIGGGCTGTGIARDLCMRGVDTMLVERGNLTDGATGSSHGLLHSGARYADSDPLAAEECMNENRVLREIAPHCVEETGGYFVKLEEDSDRYFREKLSRCSDLGIPTEVVTGSEARESEPYLSGSVEKAFRVPDAAVNPFRLTAANAADARRHGGEITTHTEVTDLVLDDSGNQVIGADVKDVDTGETQRITADHVVNAAGAWAGRLAEKAGVDVGVKPSKGVVVVMNCRPLDTVVNRCRPKSDGDIIVPHASTALLGTTNREVEDPDDYREMGWEVDLVIEECAEMVPVLDRSRVIRSFWGVRPLYEPRGVEGDGDVTRNYFVLDHLERDGVEGFTSVLGGKLTTYRLMAEETADQVCGKLGVHADCRTDTEPLPGSGDDSSLSETMKDFGLHSPIQDGDADSMGGVVDYSTSSGGSSQVVCECEGVTRGEINAVLDGLSTPDLNAVRALTWAAMGSCQGGFCCHRMAFELHPENDAEDVLGELLGLLQERWKGERHALWGEQLSQAMLNYAVQSATMNLEHIDEAVDIGRYGGDGVDGQE